MKEIKLFADKIETNIESGLKCILDQEMLS